MNRTPSGAKAGATGVGEKGGGRQPTYHETLITLTQLAEVTGQARKWFENRVKRWPKPVVVSGRGKGRTSHEWNVWEILPFIEEEHKPVADKIRTWLRSRLQT